MYTYMYIYMGHHNPGCRLLFGTVAQTYVDLLIVCIHNRWSTNMGFAVLTSG